MLLAICQKKGKIRFKELFKSRNGSIYSKRILRIDAIRGIFGSKVLQDILGSKLHISVHININLNLADLEKKLNYVTTSVYYHCCLFTIVIFFIIKF
jgi:hypothetical protein